MPVSEKEYGDLEQQDRRYHILAIPRDYGHERAQALGEHAVRRYLCLQSHRKSVEHAKGEDACPLSDAIVNDAPSPSQC